jgi:GNAT superfamily N-acetyltransferase
MSEPMPVPLAAILIELESPEFEEICAWPFADRFVGRLLRNDIPQRVQFNSCRIWAYRDPDGLFVGFGTLDVCSDYAQYTAGRPHPYVPLLAVNPTIKSRGFGTSIVWHLIGEAASLSRSPGACHDVLFLDVYTTSVKAIELYKKCGFVSLTDEPVADPLAEGGETYIVMALRVSATPA